jgi:Polyketide cyclase / dehydrase and lipid transport
MKILIRVVVGLAVLAVLLLGIGLLLPSRVHIERSIVIAANPAQVFAVVDGFGQFDQWSPWLQLDPNAKTSKSGPAEGVGARYAWSGNDKVGSGTQEIVESVPYSKVRTALTFDGFPPSEASFLLAPTAAGTHLTWTMDVDMGRNPIGHWFALGMDKMIGPDYERGLAQLKAHVESQAKPAP